MVLDPAIIAIWVLAQVAFIIPMWYIAKSGKLSNAMSLLASTLFGAAVYMAAENTLSYPKPFELEMFKAKEYRVVAVVVSPGRAVYLYLDDGGKTPRSYSMGWGPETKDFLEGYYTQKALAERGRGTVRFNPSLGSKGISAHYPKLNQLEKSGGTR